MWFYNKSRIKDILTNLSLSNYQIHDLGRDYLVEIIFLKLSSFIFMNILTFDIEEWFHIKFDNNFLEDEMSLSNYESRLNQNMEFIFDALDFQVRKELFSVWAGLQENIQT